MSLLNFIPGYGKNLEGQIVKPLGNIINKNIKDGNLIQPKSILNRLTNSAPKTLSTKIGKTNASDIYSARFNPEAAGSNIKLSEAGKKNYGVTNRAGEALTEVPLTDAGLELNRRLPFSNRYVPINKEKLMRNEFQLATTGAGLQKLVEKYGAASALGAGLAGAYGAYKYDPYDYLSEKAQENASKYGIPIDQLDVPSRGKVALNEAYNSLSTPGEFLDESNIKSVVQDLPTLGTVAKDIYSNPGVYGEGIKNLLTPAPSRKLGGDVESWEDTLDEEDIRRLEALGYTIEELD